MGVQKQIRVADISELPSSVRSGIRDSGEKENRSVQREENWLNSGQATEFLRENQKMISLGRLAATIAHEVNNPLEAVTNLLYLLEQDQGLGDRSRAFLELAQRELDRAVQICHQTLRFSRDTNEPVPVRMGELVDEVLVLFGRKLAVRRIQVIRHFGRMDTIVAFPGEMRQVITNLLSNAIEACGEEGKIIVRIRSQGRRMGRGQGGLRLSIADNGPGIPPEIRSRIGEPFFTTKGQSGTGLGLCVTKTILNSYGGVLRIRSSCHPATHGSVFSIYLPANLQPQAVKDRDRTSRNEGDSGISSQYRMSGD